MQWNTDDTDTTDFHGFLVNYQEFVQPNRGRRVDSILNTQLSVVRKAPTSYVVGRLW